MSHLRCFSLQKESNFLHGWAWESLTEICFFSFQLLYIKNVPSKDIYWTRLVWWEMQLIYFFLFRAFCFLFLTHLAVKMWNSADSVDLQRISPEEKCFFDFFGILSTLLQRLLCILFLVELTINFFIIK